MALLIALHTATEQLLPLTCDTALRAANPPREDGTSPIAEFIATLDASRLVVPEGVAHVRLRPVTQTQLELAGTRAKARAAVGEGLYDTLLCIEVARLGLLRIEGAGVDHLAPGLGGYPVDALLTPGGSDDAAAVVVEAGARVVALSTMGKAPRASSASPSGASTPAAPAAPPTPATVATAGPDGPPSPAVESGG